HLPLHLAHGHLAIALVLGVGGLLELVRHSLHGHEVDVEKEPLQLGWIQHRHILHRAVVQRKEQIALVLRECHVAAVGVDRSAARCVAQIVDGHVPHEIRRFVQMARAQKQLSRTHFIDDLLAQRERRLLLRYVGLQHCQLMIGPRQNLIGEDDHEQRDAGRGYQHRCHEALETHPARLERGYLVLSGEAAECVQGRHEHRHGQCERDREWNREKEELRDRRPWDPLSDQVPELLGDVVEQQERRESGKCECEGSEVLLENVSGEYLHGVKFTGWVSPGRPLRARRREHASPDSRGLRRARASAPSFAGPVAFAIVLAIVLSSALASPLSAQVKDTTVHAPSRLRVRIGKDTLPLQLPTVQTRTDAALYREAEAQIQAARATAFQLNSRSILESVWGQVAVQNFATGRPQPLSAEDAQQRKAREPLKNEQLFGDYADLGIQVDSRLEFRNEKDETNRCQGVSYFLAANTCRSAFEPTLDFQYALRSAGVVAERVHVNVDYDSQREFDASNTISIAFEGKPDEFIQKLEVGNVTFQPPPSRFI